MDEGRPVGRLPDSLLQLCSAILRVMKSNILANLVGCWASMAPMALLGGCGGGEWFDVTPTVTMSLMANATGANEIQLTWSPETTAFLPHYDIYRDGISLYPNHVVSGTQLVDRNLAASTQYCYVIQAVYLNLLGEFLRTGGKSNTMCIQTPAAAG